MPAKEPGSTVTVALPRDLWEQVQELAAAHPLKPSARKMLAEVVRRGYAELASDYGVRPLQDGDRPNG